MLLKKTQATTRRLAELEAVHAALDKAQAMIWFKPDGTILDANRNFLDAVGYEPDQIRGKNHRIFVPPDEAEGKEYQGFWQRLAGGEHISDSFTRLRRDGSPIHLEASYNPVLGPDGSVEKVVKFAMDVTKMKDREREFAGRREAISRAMGVIEFAPDGTILDANDNFLELMGYRIEEIRGLHHGIFAGNDMTEAELRQFWADLAGGAFKTDEFKRYGKDGKEVWLQATYAPILDDRDKVQKVVKIASDVSDTKRKTSELEAHYDTIQRGQAVIEFDARGNILTANPIFLDTMGYGLDEIRGKHHSMFVHPDYAASDEYRAFWQKLGAGETLSSKYRRFAKGGRVVWLDAVYGPVLDPAGRIVKVVKFANNVTDWKEELDVITEGLRGLSHGDLRSRLPFTEHVDFVQTRKGFNRTIDEIEEIVNRITEAASAIREDSSSIAESAEDLSTRTERQASTVEETSATMEELASTVRSNAASARGANDAAKSASSHAERGGEVVRNAIEAMKTIEQGSAQVRKIIEVIDAIAFQTNLLALNAGVEAARAGDAGKGFAVVASEVRALAQRASESASDIGALIEKSAQEVKSGSGLVNETGKVLQEIVQAVQEVSQGIEAISNASNEQSTGINEVNQAITDIDKSTQKTAAIAQDTTAAAASLRSRAVAMSDLMSFFRTVQETAGEARLAASAAPPAARIARPAPPPVSGQLAEKVEPSANADEWEEF